LKLQKIGRQTAERTVAEPMKREHRSSHTSHTDHPDHPDHPDHTDQPNPSPDGLLEHGQGHQQRLAGGDERAALASAPTPLLAELATVRRQVVALAVATRVDDRGLQAVIAARLRRSLARAASKLSEEPQGEAAARALLRSHALAAERLFAEPPGSLTEAQATRLQRWVTAPTSLGGPGASADLFELQAGGADLSSSALAQLHLLGCRLRGANLTAASVRSSVVDGCDLARAVLEATDWRGALVIHTGLQRATLNGAVLDAAIFADCDLRDADLRAGTARESIWIRCDLRGTSWTGRTMTHSHFVACRLAGARGLDTAAGVNLVRCDPPRRRWIWREPSLAEWTSQRDITAPWRLREGA
jgi:uncharacterized protein YjbI with pentapeptide repeats